MKQDVTNKDTLEELKSIRSAQAEELVHGLWLILNSEDSISRETRNRLVESWQKLEYLSKKNNLRKLIKKESKKFRKDKSK